MSKEDVINYVMTTPNNPNRAVLEGMLDGASDSGNNLLIVNATSTDYQTVVEIDKTFDEIVDFALQGGIVVMRLVLNSSGAPYANIEYLTLNGMQSDYSTSVGGGSLQFCSVKAYPDTSGISLSIKAVSMEMNGNATLKNGSKILS